MVEISDTSCTTEKKLLLLRHSNYQTLLELQTLEMEITRRFSRRESFIQTERQDIKNQLTENDKVYILKLLENMGKTLYCNCEDCLMQEAPFLAYKIAREFNRSYPIKWDKDKKAEIKWLTEFKQFYSEIKLKRMEIPITIFNCV